MPLTNKSFPNRNFDNQKTFSKLNDKIFMSFQRYTPEESYQNPCAWIMAEASNYFILNLLRETLKQQIQKQVDLNICLSRMNFDQKTQNYQKKPKAQETRDQDSQKEESWQAQRIPVKNDTKNIPKNFGKAIITFIQRHDKLVKRLLESHRINYGQYVSALKARKRNLNSIPDLRSLWVTGQFKYAKVTRILSVYFLKRLSLKYVFGSRVANYEGHIKYRNRLIEVLRAPQEFTSIKAN